MGRWKNGPDGAYYDPNDSGPDQIAPPPGSDQGGAAPAGPSPSPTGIRSTDSSQYLTPSPAPTSPSSPYTQTTVAPPVGYINPATGQPYDSTQGTDPYAAQVNAQGQPTSPANPNYSASPTAAPSTPSAPSGSSQYQTIEGVDVNKLNDPNHTTPKYVASRILASGGSIQQAAAAIGAKVLSADKMQLSTGEIIDIRRDQEGANALQWTRVDDSSPNSGPKSLGLSGGGSGAGTGTGGVGTGGAPGVSDFSTQVRNALMQQLGGLTGPLTADDPQISAEMDAQRNELERVRRDRRSADAERAAMQGLLNGGQSSGSFEQNIASGFEDKGRALTGIQAQLFTRELQSRRSHIANLLSMAMQSGDMESQRMLQLQLARMDDALRRLSLQQQQSQHDDVFGLDAARFRYGQDRDLAGFGSGAY